MVVKAVLGLEQVNSSVVVAVRAQAVLHQWGIPT